MPVMPHFTCLYTTAILSLCPAARRRARNSAAAGFPLLEAVLTNARTFLLPATLAITSAPAPFSDAEASVIFLGEGSIAGDAHDQSKLVGVLEDGQSQHDQVGGLGSALDYSGQGNIYYALPDRGPAGGKTSYINRLYRIEIKLTKLDENRYRVEPSLKETRLLQAEDGRYFTGLATAYDATNSANGLRLDPEGLRLSACGKTAYLCDEYGPHLYEIDLATGKRVRALPIPRKFLIDYPSDKFQEERDNNLAGRQHNRGFEGLAITPDGSHLLAAIQQPLLQDGALDKDKKPLGVNCRILEVNLKTGAVREFVYPMDATSNGVSEILAIDNHEFLVIEHDSKGAKETTFKKIFRIVLTDATDVRSFAALPASGTQAKHGEEVVEVKPVTKFLFVDLLNAGIPDMPEKVEGLTFGPDLDDGRHLLIVSSDNDFSNKLANRFWAFAVDRSELQNFQPISRHSWNTTACSGHPDTAVSGKRGNSRTSANRMFSHLSR